MKLKHTIIAFLAGLSVALGIASFAGLETGTYISSLVSTNPTGSDDRAQGDDHIRLIKSTILSTFPNITGAVTPTHTELNYVDGVTSAIQTQIDAKAGLASPTFTGTVTSPSFTVTGSSAAANGMYLSAANTVAWSTDSTARGSVNSTGNWVLAAPSSGATLLATGASGGNAIEARAFAGTDQVSLYAGILTGTNNPRLIIKHGEAAGTTDIGHTYSTGGGNFSLSYGGSPVITIGSNRNVTIAAPGSGDALTVNTAASSYGLVIAQQPSTPGLRISNGSGSMYMQASGGNSIVGTDGAWGLDLYTNSTQRLSVGSAGNVTIAAPSSGSTLSVAAGGNWAAWTAASAGASYMSFANAATRGYIGTDGGGILGSGTGTNFGIRAENDLYLMAGAANRVTVGSSGNVTIAAASSGDELTVTGSVVATSFAGALTGDVTGNVTGNVTGSSGSTTGNAATATKAYIPRRTSGWSNGELLSVSTGQTLNTSDIAAGSTFSLLNASNSSITLTQGASVTLYTAGTTTTGNKTVLARGIVTIYCDTSTVCYAAGNIQ